MSRDDAELVAAPGFLEDRVKEEFPGLSLLWLTVAGSVRDSPREVKRRLRELSSRYRGAVVVAMRTQAIPHAYRALFRQLGLDPDVTRIPSEQAAVERLLHGGFVSRNLVDDARLIALVETGVPVWALDAERVDAGGLGIRVAGDGERFGGYPEAPEIEPGTVVVADAAAVHAPLFGEVASEAQPTVTSRHLTLFSVGAPGVPAIHLEEALWIAVEVLRRV